MDEASLTTEKFKNPNTAKFKSDNTPQPTQNTNTTFINEDEDVITVEVDEMTIE